MVGNLHQPTLGKHTYASDLPVHRRLYDEIAIRAALPVDNIAFLTKKLFNSSGIDYKNVFSPAKGAVVYSISIKIRRLHYLLLNFE